jgi:hypothetical protein
VNDWGRTLWIRRGEPIDLVMKRGNAEREFLTGIDVGIGSSISGERPVVRIQQTDEAEADRAHREVERAIARGVSAVLADEDQHDGLREQQTAWLMADGQLVVSTWYQAPDQRWSRGPSKSVSVEGVAKLAALLEQNGR